MKDKQAACVILIILIAIMAYATQKFFGMMSDAKNEAAERVQAAQGAQAQFNTAQIALTRFKEDTREVREFHSAWTPYFATTTTNSWQSTEQRILDSIKESDIFAEEQRFEMLEMKENPLIKNTLRAHLVVQDEYSKVFNWFGELEEAFPTSRVTSCKLSRGKAGDNIRIQLILDFPVTDKA